MKLSQLLGTVMTTTTAGQAIRQNNNNNIRPITDKTKATVIFSADQDISHFNMYLMTLRYEQTIQIINNAQWYSAYLGVSRDHTPVSIYLHKKTSRFWIVSHGLDFLNSEAGFDWTPQVMQKHREDFEKVKNSVVETTINADLPPLILNSWNDKEPIYIHRSGPISFRSSWGVRNTSTSYDKFDFLISAEDIYNHAQSSLVSSMHADENRKWSYSIDDISLKGVNILPIIEIMDRPVSSLDYIRRVKVYKSYVNTQGHVDRSRDVQMFYNNKDSSLSVSDSLREGEETIIALTDLAKIGIVTLGFLNPASSAITSTNLALFGEEIFSSATEINHLPSSSNPFRTPVSIRGEEVQNLRNDTDSRVDIDVSMPRDFDALTINTNYWLEVGAMAASILGDRTTVNIEDFRGVLDATISSTIYQFNEVNVTETPIASEAN